MLYEVGIGPYLLVRIAGHVAVGLEESGGVLDMVVARLPGGTVTGGTAYLGEQLLAFLEVVGGSVAGCRNSQAAVPYHEVLVLGIGHLCIKLLAGQIGVDVLLQVAGVPLRMCVRGVDAVDVLREAGLYLGVL